MPDQQALLAQQSRYALVFSSLGHAYMHMLTAFFFVLVLALESSWKMPYHELIRLWTVGALLVGVCAIPAGWIADRWSAPGMLVLMFLGMGLACLGSAMAGSPFQLMLGLSALGVFASIYHPVGIPWLVRSVRASGKALGVNGIFGGLGMAAAGIITGVLVDLGNWRVAFAVPGAISVLTGLVMAWAWRSGRLSEGLPRTGPGGDVARGAMLRVFATMLVTMFCLGFAYQVCQAAFPKLFDLRLEGTLGEGTSGVGLLITGVYTVAALVQVIGGHLADRYPLKWIYLAGFLLQVPVMSLLGSAAGVPLIVMATSAVLLTTMSLPAENMLLSRYSPARHQGLAFGVKFVIAFGTAPLAIGFVSWLSSSGNDLGGLFRSLAALAALGGVACLTLPGEPGRA